MQTLTTKTSKSQLGQFFTIQSDYILQGFEKYIFDKDVTDPFAGSGDLLNWAQKHVARSIVGFDIDVSFVDGSKILQGDSLLEIRNFDFVLTNPPYLYINKASQEIKNKYFRGSNFDDLYQISIASIMNSKEGIIIVPINFLSAENSKKIRKIFFEKFRIPAMNYFRHQVFPDTTYNVIAFYYKEKEHKFKDGFVIKTKIFPDEETASIKLEAKYDWTIGGDFITAISNQTNSLGIFRLTERDIKPGSFEIPVVFGHLNNKGNVKVDRDTYDLVKQNILLLKAIDTGSEDGKICLENIKKYGVECLISKPTSRHQIYLVFRKPISIECQKRLIGFFNDTIEKMREKHLSLFMTNYRDNDRKRVSFDFVYKLINYFYYTKIKGEKIEEQSLLF